MNHERYPVRNIGVMGIRPCDAWDVDGPRFDNHPVYSSSGASGGELVGKWRLLAPLAEGAGKAASTHMAISCATFQNL